MQKREISGIGKTGAVNSVINHCEVERRIEKLVIGVGVGGGGGERGLNWGRESLDDVDSFAEVAVTVSDGA